MSKRTKIVKALTEKIRDINGASPYSTNLYGNVYQKLKFWDEIDDYPSVFVTTGPETREYHPGGFKWGYITVTVRVYVRSENPEEELESIFEDIEILVDNNGTLIYDDYTGSKIEDLRIMTINTDEGLLAPIGVGDITLHIMYDLESN